MIDTKPLSSYEAVFNTENYQSLPKIGVIAVSANAGEVLSSLKGRLSHLSRLVIIDSDPAAFKDVVADRKILATDVDVKVQISESVTGLDFAFVLAGSTEIAHLVTEVLRQKQIFFISMPNPVCKTEGNAAFEILYRAITSPIFEPGYVTVDFESIQKSFLSVGGHLALGYGSARGESAAESAASVAISHHLLGIERLRTAKSILVSIDGPPAGVMKLRQINSILKTIRHAIENSEHKLTIIFGANYNQNLADEYQVTILAAGVSVKGATAAL